MEETYSVKKVHNQSNKNQTTVSNGVRILNKDNI